MQTIVNKGSFFDNFIINPLFIVKKECNLFSDVSQKDLDELLCLYPQNERIITNCRYSKGKLIAELVAKDISYSLAKPNYYTGEQLIMAISQLGYLLSGLIIKDNEYTNVDRNFYKSYLLKIQNLDCYYTRLNMVFKKKLKKESKNIIEMSTSKVNYYSVW